MASEKLLLDFLDNSQVLPHEFNTNTIWSLDAAAQPLLLGTNVITDPPASPAIGDTYHVQYGPEGSLWFGLREVLATWTGGTWTATGLYTGFKAHIAATNDVRYYRSLPGGGGTWVTSEQFTTQTWSIPNPTDIPHNPGEVVGSYPLFYAPPSGVEILSIRARLYGVSGSMFLAPFFNGRGGALGGGATYFSQVNVATGRRLAESQVLNVNDLNDSLFLIPPGFQEVSDGWCTIYLSAQQGTPTLLALNVLTTSGFN